MARKKKKKTILRAGFKEDFVIFHVEWEFKITKGSEEGESVEWIDDPQKPKKIFRVNMIVAIGFMTMFLGIASFIK